MTIGLWKDMIKGWRELEIADDDKPKGLLFTVSSVLKEEFTLDGRTDYSQASVFRMDTVNPIPIYFDEKATKLFTTSIFIKNKISTWDDIRELSAAFFSIDAIIDLLYLYKCNQNKVKSKSYHDSIELLLSLLEQKNDTASEYFFLSKIKKNIYNSWKELHEIGIEATTNELQKKENDLTQFVTMTRELIKLVMNTPDCKTQVDYYNLLVNKCEFLLDKIPTDLAEKGGGRIQKLTLLAFLFNLSTKLSYKKYINTTNFKGGVSIKGAQEIIVKIENIIKYQ